MTVDEFLQLNEIYAEVFPSQDYKELKQFQNLKAKRTFKPESVKPKFLKIEK